MCNRLLILSHVHMRSVIYIQKRFQKVDLAKRSICHILDRSGGTKSIQLRPPKSAIYIEHHTPSRAGTCLRDDFCRRTKTSFHWNPLKIRHTCPRATCPESVTESPSSSVMATLCDSLITVFPCLSMKVRTPVIVTPGMLGRLIAALESSSLDSEISRKDLRDHDGGDKRSRTSFLVPAQWF